MDALLSIGGWTGSIYFSNAVGSAQNRTAFARAIVALAKKYNLDGVDFECVTFLCCLCLGYNVISYCLYSWEYPGKQGLGCNIVSNSDSANFLLFLQELRKDSVGSKLKLTVAVGLGPFVGANGAPMTDVSQFAPLVDYIGTSWLLTSTTRHQLLFTYSLAIMSYDVWGSWSTTVGPNAPLDDSCAPAKEGSATSAVKAWTAAGFPASKVNSFHIYIWTPGFERCLKDRFRSSSLWA